MVYKVYRKFSRTGSVANAPHSGRPSTATNEPNMYSVAQAFVENPSQSAPVFPLVRIFLKKSFLYGFLYGFFQKYGFLVFCTDFF